MAESAAGSSSKKPGVDPHKVLERKSEFVMAAAHQLKSPVSIVQWCLQSALEMDTELAPKTRTYISQALQQADMMSQLIVDLLHMVRLANREGEAVHKFERIDMNVLINEVFEQYSLVAHQRGIHLIRGATEQLPSVYAEEVYLRQALINLVDNAIKYSNQGDEVVVSAQLNRDSMVEVRVADEGIGISEAEQAQLFNEFYRSENAKQHTREGTGLGLVLVKHIVEAFGGAIHLHSEINQGSVFTITLPSTKPVETKKRG